MPTNRDIINSLGVAQNSISAPEETSIWRKAGKIALKAGITTLETVAKVGGTADAAAIGTLGTIGSFAGGALKSGGTILENAVGPLLTNKKFNPKRVTPLNEVADEAVKVGNAAWDTTKKMWSPGGKPLMPHNIWNTIVRNSDNEGLAVSDQGVVPFVMDWGDPISNTIFGAAGKVAGKVARPILKYGVAAPSSAIYKAAVAKIVSMPTMAPAVEGAARLVNKLENSRWSNIAIRGRTAMNNMLNAPGRAYDKAILGMKDTALINALNYGRRLVTRAEQSQMFNETKGMRLALFDFESKQGKKIGKTLDKWANATSPEQKQLLEAELKSQHIIPPTGSIEEIAQIRKSLEGVAREDRTAVLEAAYVDSTGHMTEEVAKDYAARIPGFTYTIDPKTDMLHFDYQGNNPAIAGVLDNVRRIRQEQRAIGAPILDINSQTGLKVLDNTSGIAAMLGYISPVTQIPIETRNTLQMFVNKWTTTDTLLQKVPSPRVANFDLNTIPNAYMGQIAPTSVQTMSREAQVMIYDAFHEVAPHLDALPDPVKKNILSFIATIPEMRNIAMTVENLRGALTPDLMKLLERDPAAGLGELKKIGAVKDILEKNKVRSVLHLSMVEQELRNRGLDDAANFFQDAIHRDPQIFGQKKLDVVADMSMKQLQDHLSKAVTPTAARNIGGAWRDAAIADIDNLAIDDTSKAKLRRVYDSMTDERLSKLKTQEDLDKFLAVRDRKVNSIINKSGAPAIPPANPVGVTFPSTDIAPEVESLTNDIMRGISQVDMLGQASIVKRVEDFVRVPYSLDSAVRQYYALDTSVLQHGRFPGANAAGKTVRTLDKAKQAAAASVEQKGYDPAVVPALSRMLGWQDDAYGRVMVNAGIMTAEDFARNKGTHLVRGYKFFNEKQALVAYRTRLQELEQAGDPASLSEAQMLKDQWADREIQRERYLRSVGKKPSPFAMEVKAEDWGGFNSSAYRRRQKLPATLERVLRPYDNIADAWTLSQAIGTKNVTVSNYYQTLKEMGLLVSDKSEAQHGWVVLDGSSWGPARGWYAHPWLATRLQNQNLEGAMNGWTNLVGQTKKLMLADVMTTARNVVSNMIAIHMGTDGASTGEIVSSLYRGFQEYHHNGELARRFNMFGKLETDAVVEQTTNRLSEIEKFMQSPSKTFIGKSWDAIAGMYNAVTTGQFNMIENVSKLGMFDLLMKRNPAKSDLEHVLQVEKWMVDYHDVPAIVDLLRRKTGMFPFITYAYKMAGNIARSTYENPEIAAKMYGKVYKVNQGNSIGGEFGAEAALMPKYMDNRLLLKLPSGIKGVTDKDVRGKSGTAIDMTYFLPHSLFSPFFEMKQDAGEGLPGSILKTLVGLSPVLTAMSEMYNNKTFLGNQVTYGGNAIQQGKDYASYLGAKLVPLAMRINRSLAAAQHVNELGLAGKSKTEQSFVDKFISARHYELQDQVRVEMQGIQGQLKALRKTNLQMLDRIRRSEMVPDIMGGRYNQPLENRIKPQDIINRNNDKITQLLQRQQELDKKALKIQHLTDLTDILGVDRAAAETYEQFIIDNNESMDKSSNFTRLAEGIEAGDWTKNLAPSVKAAIAEYMQSGGTGVAQAATPPVTQPVQGTGFKGSMGTSSDLAGKANRSISKSNIPTLLPPPRR